MDCCCWKKQLLNLKFLSLLHLNRNDLSFPFGGGALLYKWPLLLYWIGPVCCMFCLYVFFFFFLPQWPGNDSDAATLFGWTWVCLIMNSQPRCVLLTASGNGCLPHKLHLLTHLQVTFSAEVCLEEEGMGPASCSAHLRPLPLEHLAHISWVKVMMRHRSSC